MAGIAASCKGKIRASKEPGPFAGRSRPASPARYRYGTTVKDGGVFWNELILSPVLDQDGSLSHFIGIQYDITARMAGKDVDRDFKNFASHELNTPLTTIKGTLQLLQLKGLAIDAGFVQKSLQAALRAVERLEEFRKELLN